MKKFLNLIAAFIIIANSVFAQQQLNTPDNIFPNSDNFGTPIANSPAISLQQLPNINVKTINSQVPVNFNYKRILRPLSEYANPQSVTFSTSNVIAATSYFDGWGRILHTNVRGKSNGRDIITPSDTRISTTILQFPSYADSFKSRQQINPALEQKNYYLSTQSTEDGASYGFTKQEMVGSVVQQKVYPIGKAFSGQSRGFINSVTFNVVNEIPRWRLSGNNIISTGYYTANKLEVTHTIGQNSAESYQYTNSDGQLICTKIVKDANGNTDITYYVYDDFNRLRFIATPKAVATGITVNGTTQTLAQDLTYSFKYDEYGRLVEKKVPDQNGANMVVYDSHHRAVLTQSPLLAAQNKWAFNIYDSRDRVVITGLIDNSAYNKNRTAWQNELNTGTNVTDSLIKYLKNGCLYEAPLSITNADILTYNYYDNYQIQTGKPSSLYNTMFNGAFAVGSGAVFPQPYTFTDGMLTASRSKIIDGAAAGISNSWVMNVYYYDQQGRNIQTQTLNPWNSTNWDINATQYNFTGQVVRHFIRFHGWSGCNKLNTTVGTKYDYDSEDGKLVSVMQQTDQGGWRDISSYEYNDLGQVSKKKLGNLEIQNYSYNIRGQLRGINQARLKNLAVADIGTIDFAESISYEAGFSRKRYDGKITGYEWSSPSLSSRVQSYGYDYDVLGRLTCADYREWSPNPDNGNVTEWNAATRNYSMSGVTFDENGNMLTMVQKGPNSSNITTNIDKLTYTYDGNRLMKVTDSGNIYSPSVADFLNGNSGTNNDYTYDANGNLKSDLNKAITNIDYSHLDLPLTVTNSSGHTITNTYDATGTLLAKNITEGTTNTRLRYWGPFVYRSTDGGTTWVLDYLMHEEGRCRWVVGDNAFKYDYFVKDHLGNVRSAITADVSTSATEYLATHELASAGIENVIFGNLDAVREIRPEGVPGDMRSAELDGNNPQKRIGTSLLLKVMAGDHINLSTWSYYSSGGDYNTHATAEDMLSSITSTLSGGVGGYAGGAEGNGASYVSALFTPANYTDVYDALKESATNAAIPRAYLNYIFFDEDMRVDRSLSGAIQIGANPDQWNYINLPQELQLGRNGYLAVYVSNEQRWRVHFDDVHLTHYHGSLLEEHHYYPHGLLITTSTAGGTMPKDKYQFEGKKMQEELGLQLYDFHARQYDPQLGRFWGVDPLDEFASGYTGMGNDPANLTDPTGMAVVGGTQGPGRIVHDETNEENDFSILEEVNESEEGTDEIAELITQEGGGYTDDGGSHGDASYINNDIVSNIGQSTDVSDNDEHWGPDKNTATKKDEAPKMNVSPKGQEFIMSFEKFRPEPYDANPGTGDWTIGYGHKIQPGEKFTTINETQGRDLFLSDLKTKGTDPVDRYVKVPLTQQQYDALVSYVFNAGSSNTIQV